jgi:hypothetical protein
VKNVTAEAAKVEPGTGYIVDLGTNNFTPHGHIKSPYYDFIYVIRTNNA